MRPEKRERSLVTALMSYRKVLNRIGTAIAHPNDVFEGWAFALWPTLKYASTPIAFALLLRNQKIARILSVL